MYPQQFLGLYRDRCMHENMSCTENLNFPQSQYKGYVWLQKKKKKRPETGSTGIEGGEEEGGEEEKRRIKKDGKDKLKKSAINIISKGKNGVNKNEKNIISE